MSIEINSIKNTPSTSPSDLSPDGQRAGVAFKTNPMPQDKVEISSKKKRLSDGAKIGIGIGALTLIGVGIYKRKSLKKFWEKLFGKGGKKPEKPKGTKEGEKPQTTGASSLPHVADFKNIDEAKTWFDNFGIRPEFMDVKNSDLEYISKIANDFAELDRLGVAVSKPDSLVISDWTKINELSNLYNTRSINHDINELERFTGYWGRAQVDTNGKNHVFFNVNKLSTVANLDIVQHEIGHHCRIVGDSVLNKINDLGDLGSKKLELLGYRPNLPHRHIFGNNGAECWKTTEGGEFVSSLSNNSRFERTSPVLSGKGITDLFKQEVAKSYGYKDYEADEFAADIFKGLTTGKTFSDEVMLAYDFINGGRVPNLIIKGKKYDDYIKSLYENPEMVQKLRDMIKLKYVERIVDGRAVLKDANKEMQEFLMRGELQP